MDYRKTRENRIRRTIVLAVIAGVLLAVSGCGSRQSERPDPAAPTVITFWHAYNAVAKARLDELVQEFNETAGMEEGILVDARGYGSSVELEEALYASANHIMGSDALPDLFTSYPDNAYRLDQIAPLVNFDDYLAAEELSRYREEFLAEGVFDESGSHKMIPVAKSTELLFLNKTDWEVFSEETGVSEEMLGTWEGLSAAAERYYEWSGGNPFLGMNSYNDFAVLTAAQQGQESFTGGEDGGFRYTRETARKAWEAYYVPHIRGWYKSSVYNQDGIKSGKLMAYIGSSAGAGFFPGEVIENENSFYEIECSALLYPSFQTGNAYMTQRGANIAAFAADEVREYAAAKFISWFTEPEQNIRFAVSTGYLPVQNEALHSVGALVGHIEEENNSDAVKKSLQISIEAMNEKKFYVRKPFPKSYEMNQVFNTSLEDCTAAALDEMDRREADGEKRELLESEFLNEEHFNNWYDTLMEKMAGINYE